MKRLPRINGHGLVRCVACERWLDPTEFGYPPSLGGKPTSYCHGCQREIDRMRWRGDRREIANRQRIVHQRRQQQAERAGRIRFVQGAIRTLRRRGLTKSDIVKLIETSWTGLLSWERGDTMPVPQIAERFVVLLHETAYLPLATNPVIGRRLPHPDFDALMERCRPQVLAFPVRSRWKDAS